MNIHYEQPRCNVCGKYIEYEQINGKDAVVILVQNSEYAAKSVYVIHTKCGYDLDQSTNTYSKPNKHLYLL